ncbi:hypothetical protein DFJ73DRAFT_580617 [Zopfochytrium polystomum]|nr:hypothetical protein DFJ73DRAFT_580617 [Zopfochytrium polystomum]
MSLKMERVHRAMVNSTVARADAEVPGDSIDSRFAAPLAAEARGKEIRSDWGHLERHAKVQRKARPLEEDRRAVRIHRLGDAGQLERVAPRNLRQDLRLYLGRKPDKREWLCLGRPGLWRGSLVRLVFGRRFFAYAVLDRPRRRIIVFIMVFLIIVAIAILPSPPSRPSSSSRSSSLSPRRSPSCSAPSSRPSSEPSESEPPSRTPPLVFLDPPGAAKTTARTLLRHRRLPQLLSLLSLRPSSELSDPKCKCSFTDSAGGGSIGGANESP